MTTKLLLYVLENNFEKHSNIFCETSKGIIMWRVHCTEACLDIMMQ